MRATMDGAALGLAWMHAMLPQRLRTSSRKRAARVRMCALNIRPREQPDRNA